MLKLTIAAAIFVASTSVASESGVPTECLSGMGRALVAGGFSGGVFCSTENATFRLAGTTGSGAYAIYDYRYRFMPQHGAVAHGGQRMVVFKDGQYVGQYSLSPPSFAALSVRGSEVLVQKDDDSDIAVLDFSNGPPQQALVDGYVVGLYR